MTVSRSHHQSGGNVHMHKLYALAAAGVLAMGVAACGGDDEEE